MSLVEKAILRRERIANRANRENKSQARDSSLPDPRGESYLKIGSVRIKTTNRQERDDRGLSTRTPPERTKR